MAEYCSQCSPFENRCDFNLFKIATHLRKGQSKNFLCEGCNNRAVNKDEDGNFYLTKLEGKVINLHLINLDEL